MDNGATQLDGTRPGIIRGSCSDRGLLRPTKFFKSRIADAEVVSNLVKDRFADLCTHVVFIETDLTNRCLIERYSVRHHAAVTLKAAFRERYPFVQTEERSPYCFTLHNDYYVVDACGERFGQRGQCLRGQFLKTLVRNLKHLGSVSASLIKRLQTMQWPTATPLPRAIRRGNHPLE